MAIARKALVRWILIVGVALGWTAAVLWLGLHGPAWVESHFSSEEELVKVAKYYPLDKFIISIPGDKYPHYLLLEMTLKSRNPALQSVLDEADPVIRNSLMKMFSRKRFEQLNDSDQLDSLQAEALVLIAKVLSDNDFASDVDEVLFTRMVMQ
ncbi:flagellar basal body-associated FliL family protein [Shewanella salipaludis]|uniref:Flagellar protein FliL n=1 Tax=Shewanella salipaludis TaxID=2723052 RepID=A0A972G3U9_9GAMM|nr:flagellar basal body-associated FliL family protein [Shewanella salipaludis]NMH66719.1 flagellar basal body-associated FliL family protein [Shewanella salipaludis]